MPNERRWLKIRDYLTIKPSEVLENKRFIWECKDSKTETGHSLLVRVAATHAGIVTGNRKFYRPDFMAESVHTWLPDNLAPRPVLRAHDEEGDVLGRVREAKFVDSSYKYKGDYPILLDSVFYNRDSRRRLNSFKTIEWITDNLVVLPEYSGLGYIELGLQITNPEAIEKVLRDEYLCVSAGARTDEAICSACHTDWASDDKCSHKIGQIVDGKRVFHINGRFKYEELSFVNFGADPFAMVKSKELKDGLEKMFFLGLPLQDQQDALDRGLKIADSLYESDIQISYEESAMTIDLAAVEQTIKNPELTQAQAFAVRDQLLAFEPQSDADKSSKRSLQSTLTAKIRKQGWKIEDPAAVADATAVVDADDLKGMTAVADGEIAGALAEAEGQASLEVAETVVTDAVKTEAGDPAPAAAVSGSVVISDEMRQFVKDELKLTDADEACATCQKLLSGAAKAEAFFNSADDDHRSKIISLGNALGRKFDAEQSLAWYKGYLTNHDSLALVSKDELALKDETVLGLDTEVKTLKETVTAKDRLVAACLLDSKTSLATTLVMYRTLRGAEGFKGLSPQQIQDKITELKGRQMQSLKDAVKDVFSELQWVQPTSEPAAKSNDSVTTVTDNKIDVDAEATRVRDGAEAPASATKAQDAAVTLHRMLRYIPDLRDQNKLRADVKAGRVKL